MSSTAAALARALIRRSGAPGNRILLSAVETVDWRSLTFAGERHLIHFRIPAPNPRLVIDALRAGLEEAEFHLPGSIVADIAVAHAPTCQPDGSMCIAIEALTVADD